VVAGVFPLGPALTPCACLFQNACSILGIGEHFVSDKSKNVYESFLDLSVHSPMYRVEQPPSSVGDVLGDGNCLFRALSHIVTGGSENAYDEIRSRVSALCVGVHLATIALTLFRPLDMFVHGAPRAEVRSPDREVRGGIREVHEGDADRRDVGIRRGAAGLR
jgi:hypothetical protein